MRWCQLALTVAVCRLVHATAITSELGSLPRLPGRQQQQQEQVVSKSRLAPFPDDTHLQQHPSAQLQNALMSRKGDQHPGPSQRVDTPGSHVSRLIPDEWKPAVSWFLTILLFAFFFKRLAFYVPDVDPLKMHDASPSFTEWRHDLFDCCGEPVVCILACMFPSISLADNMTKTRSGAFFATVIVSAFIIASNFMVIILPWFAFAMYCTFQRQKLRAAFEMELVDNSIGMDCLSYVFCNPCTLTQDARHIQEAAEAGHLAIEHNQTRLRMYF